jgi:hypothetical protein
LSWALQERLRGDGAKVELTVDSSVVGYSPDSNNVRTKAEEFSLQEAVARERLTKTQQGQKRLSGCCGDMCIVDISCDAVNYW